eukprot:1138365-Pelagomonas_calceolata.AAC.5
MQQEWTCSWPCSPLTGHFRCPALPQSQYMNGSSNIASLMKAMVTWKVEAVPDLPTGCVHDVILLVYALQLCLACQLHSSFFLCARHPSRLWHNPGRDRRDCKTISEL